MSTIVVRILATPLRVELQQKVEEPAVTPWLRDRATALVWFATVRNWPFSSSTPTLLTSTLMSA